MVSRRGFLAAFGSGLFALGGCSAPTTRNRFHPGGTGRPALDRSDGGAGGVRTDRSTSGGATTAGPGEEGAWPMYGFDAANTGFNPETSGPRGDITRQWQQYVPGVNSTSAPSVVDGAVFVSNRRSVLRFDAATGDLTWQAGTGSFNSYHTPAVDGDAVYVAGRRQDFSSIGLVDRDLTTPGRLTALDAAEGERRWQRTTQISSAPVVHGDRVYYTAMHPDGGASVRAVDAASGDDRWQESVEAVLPVERVTPPACADGSVYATVYSEGTDETSGHVLALDAADGTRRWTVRTDEGIRSSPSVADGRLYAVTEDGTLHALATDDGSRLWTARPETGRAIDVPPAVAYGAVFVGGADGIAAVDAVEGTVDSTEYDKPLSMTAFAIADHTLYLGGIELAAVSTADGTVEWRFQNEGFHSAYAGPAVADGTLYATACIKQTYDDPYTHAVLGFRGGASE